LSLVGLDSFAEKLPAAVAGGQQQAAAIARALANDPPILIADEPTGNLDSQTASEIFGLFCGLIERGKTVLMVTHDPALAQQTTRTLLLSDGELIDPWIATAYPDLMHHQMLWMSQHVTLRQLPPGTPLSETADSKFGLWIVTKGSLELRQPDALQPCRLNAGQGICNLPGSAMDWQNITLQAGVEEPLELREINGSTLVEWLNETPGAGAELEKANPACWTAAGQMEN
jgi:putative ABC transport system ATP-binding protein